nr:MAG TPA: hypothetical protein [Caudoviricetes sp.]
MTSTIELVTPHPVTSETPENMGYSAMICDGETTISI